MEQKIEKLTGRLDELNHLLAQPDTYEKGGFATELHFEYQELKGTLEEQNLAWEETALQLEEMEESFWKNISNSCD